MAVSITIKVTAADQVLLVLDLTSAVNAAR